MPNTGIPKENKLLDGAGLSTVLGLIKTKIPTAVSDLENDAGYITSAEVTGQVQSDWNQADSSAVDYIKNKPTKVSDFTNDSNFIDATALTPYATTDSLTTTLDSRYVNVTGDTMTGSLEISGSSSNLSHLDSTKLIFSTIQIIEGPYGDVGVEVDDGLQRLNLVGTYMDDPIPIQIGNVADPTTNSDAANKQYVDDSISSAVASISVPVISVNGATGNVVLDADNISYSATQSIKDKIDDIVTAGGEPNVIETVKVNGTALTPVNKEVDVIVPTKVSDLTNDVGFVTSSATSGLATLTDLEGYVPTSRTINGKTLTTNITLNASDVSAMSSSHVASTITATDISNWNSKSDFSGSYNDLTDKPTIPTAESFTSIYDSRYSAISHTHDYSKVTVTQGVTTGVTIGTIAVDNNGTTTTTTLYAPNSKASEIIDLAGTTTALSYPSGESFATIKGYIDSGKVVYLRVNDYPALHHLHIFESNVIQFVETAGLDTHYISLNDDGTIDYSEQIVTVQDGRLVLS